MECRRAKDTLGPLPSTGKTQEVYEYLNCHSGMIE